MAGLAQVESVPVRLIRRKPMRINRKFSAQRGHLVRNLAPNVFIARAVKRPRNQVTDQAHFLLLHATTGDGGRTKANSAGDKWRPSIERYGVAVHGNVRPIEGLL